MRRYIFPIFVLLTILASYGCPAQSVVGSGDSLGMMPRAVPVPYSPGSISFGGSVGYTSTVPDVGESMSTFTAGVNTHLFVVPRVSIGADFAATNVSVGSRSVTTTELGPAIRFMFGSPTSKSFPYLHMGYRSLNTSVSYGWGTYTLSGNSFRAGVGFLFRRWMHVGMVIELAANSQKINNTSTTVFGVTFGLSGLVYGLF
jgi:hypothetical protein